MSKANNNQMPHVATVPFRKIEDAYQFMKWAESVNEANLGGDFLCDLQDVYARSDEKTLKSLFLATVKPHSTEARLLTFGVFKAMGEEKVFDLLKSWAKQAAQKIIDEYIEQVQEREDAIFKREQTLDNCKRPIHKKIGDLHRENARLRHLNKELTRVNTDHHRIMNKQESQIMNLQAINYNFVSKEDTLNSKIKDLKDALERAGRF